MLKKKRRRPDLVIDFSINMLQNNYKVDIPTLCWKDYSFHVAEINKIPLAI